MGLNRLRNARLISLIIGVSILPYFIILFQITPIWFSFIEDFLVNQMMNLIGLPLLFSSPWLLIFYIYGTQISGGLVLMSEDTKLVPKRWRLFYGFNALIILVFLGFPVGTPFLLVVSIAVIVGRIIGRYISVESNRRLPWILWFVLTGLIISPLIWLFIEYLPNAFPFYYWLIEEWITYLPTIYLSSTILVNTLTIVDFFAIFYQYRSQKEIKNYGVRLSDPPTSKSLLAEVIIFLGLCFLVLPTPISYRWLITLLGSLSLILMAFSLILQFVFKIKKEKQESSIGSILIATAFILLYIFEVTNTLLLSGLIFLAAGLFGISFFQGFYKAANLSTKDFL